MQRMVCAHINRSRGMSLTLPSMVTHGSTLRKASGRSLSSSRIALSRSSPLLPWWIYKTTTQSGSTKIFWKTSRHMQTASAPAVPVAGRHTGAKSSQRGTWAVSCAGLPLGAPHGCSKLCTSALLQRKRVVRRLVAPASVTPLCCAFPPELDLLARPASSCVPAAVSCSAGASS